MEGKLNVPVLGKVKDIAKCSDSVFAEKMLGDGILVIPSDGKIVSPCDASVFNIMKSKHAITLVSDEGIELLIHIGIDTVELEGQGFISYVSDKDKVSKGQLLIEVDFNYIKEQGYDPSTILIILSKDLKIEKQNLDMVLENYDDVMSCTK